MTECWRVQWTVCSNAIEQKENQNFLSIRKRKTAYFFPLCPAFTKQIKFNLLFHLALGQIEVVSRSDTKSDVSKIATWSFFQASSSTSQCTNICLGAGTKLSPISKRKTLAVRKMIRQNQLKKRRKIQIWNKTEGEGWRRPLQENTMQWQNDHLGKGWARKHDQNSASRQRLKGPTLSGNRGQHGSEMGCARIGMKPEKKALL